MSLQKPKKQRNKRTQRLMTRLTQPNRYRARWIKPMLRLSDSKPNLSRSLLLLFQSHRQEKINRHLSNGAQGNGPYPL